MNTALLMLQAANELMYGVERAFSAYLVYDIIKRLVIETQNPRAQMDGLFAWTIPIADKLGIEAAEGVLQAWVRGFKVDNDHLADGKTSLQEEIKRKGYDLGLPTQSCQECMCILRHNNLSFGLNSNRQEYIQDESLTSSFVWWTS